MTNWQTKKLSELGTFSKGAGIPKDSVLPEGLPAVRYGELYTAFDTFIKNVRSYIDESTARESKEIRRGDILFAGSGETIDEIGKSAVYQHSDFGYAGGDIVTLSPDTSSSSLFLAYALNSPIARKDLRRLGQGQSVVHVYRKDLEEMSLSLPEKPEQQRIVAVLEVWDEYLELLDRKIVLKEQLKKGLMQQLLTGKKRLPGFTDEWRSVAVGEFLKERKEYASKDGKYEHISLTTKGVVPKTARYERDFLVMAEDKQYRITKVDDICYNPANLKFGVIARNKYKTAIFSPIYVTYEVEGQDVSFIEHLVTSYIFIGKALRYEEGTVYERMAVHPNDLAVMKISLPSIEEQCAISKIIDTHELEHRTLVSLQSVIRNQKKYLLKNLISGTIRTPENLHIKGVN